MQQMCICIAFACRKEVGDEKKHGQHKKGMPNSVVICLLIYDIYSTYTVYINVLAKLTSKQKLTKRKPAYNKNWNNVVK